MSEKEKIEKVENNKDVEIKKFEEEIEEAIDELFVPLAGDSKGQSGDGSSVVHAEGPKVPEEAGTKGREEKTNDEDKVKIPNLESSIEAAIDELFVDTTSKTDKETKSPEVVSPQSAEGKGDQEEKPEASVSGEGSEESVASEDQLYAEVVDLLKEKLLSLDWEISAANIRAMEKALNELPPEVTSNAKIVSIVRMMQGVLKYLATVRYSASPLSIQFLRDAMEALEKLMISPAVGDEEGKKIIGELVNKFRRLKYEAKKYQKVKVKKEITEKKVEEHELPEEVVPDVLEHVGEIQKSLKAIVDYNKKIKVCINRVQNLLSRYERLQAVLERKPALAKVSNYFGETTRGMVQEINGIEGYLRELKEIFEHSSKVVEQHKEILKKKAVKKVPEEPAGEGETEKLVSEKVQEDTSDDFGSRGREDVAGTADDQKPVVPAPLEGDSAKTSGGVLLEPVGGEGLDEAGATAEAGNVEPATADLEAAEEEEKIPEIDIPEPGEAPVAETVDGQERELEVSDDVAEESAETEPPEVPPAAESETTDGEEKAGDSESSFESVYLVTVAGQVVAIPSKFVANVYCLPERKIGLINSKGYAFLKELKPFYRSIKSGLCGPLAEKSKGELKNLKADVVKLDLRSANVDEDVPRRQKGIVLLSNGEQAALLCTDERVSKRPTPVTNFEGDHGDGYLSGRVEIEGQFNVPVINVEKILLQLAN